MLALFRNNQATGGFLLVLVAALLRLGWLRGFPSAAHGAEAGFFAEEVMDRLASASLVWPAFLAFLTAILMAFLANRTAADFRISNEATWYPGLFCLVMASSAPDFLRLSPPLIASVFSILAFRNLFGTFNAKSEGPIRLFNVGFWLAMAGLAYPPAFLLVSPLLLGLASLRGFVFRERMMAFLGFLSAILLVWTGYFWFDAGGWFWEKHFWQPFGLPDFSAIWKNPAQLGRLGILLFAVFAVAFLAGGLFQKKLIQQQKFISILFWWLIAAVASCFLLDEFRFEHFVLAAPPLGILLGAAFLTIKNRAIADVLSFLMLGAAVALGFFR